MAENDIPIGQKLEIFFNSKLIGAVPGDFPTIQDAVATIPSEERERVGGCIRIDEVESTDSSLT